MSCSASAVTTWQSIIQAASTANEQLEHQGRKCKQAHDCLAKLLQASRMRTARLYADQRMLRQMLDKVKTARKHHQCAPIHPSDMFPPWQHSNVSHSWQVGEEEVEVVMQELKDVLSSFVAANACHETWSQLGPILAKMPPPVPEIISGPGPETLPLPHLQNPEQDGMDASAMPLHPQTAMNAYLVPAPEFKLSAATTALPGVYDSNSNGSTVEHL